MRVHQRIRKYIDDSGILMNKVAERAEIEQKRFYRIINGKSEMTPDEYEVICRKGLAIDPSFFFQKKFSNTEKSA